MPRIFFPFLLFFLPAFPSAQPYTYLDTLAGSLRPERTAFDVNFYGLYLEIDPSMRRIDGYVDIEFTVLTPVRVIQLDLDERFRIRGVSKEGKELDFHRCNYPSSAASQIKGGGQFRDLRECNGAFFVDFGRELSENSRHTLRVHYGGPPKVAKNPPWDGGFVWALDHKDRSWVGVTCEGPGARVWWPNKDHLSDEPDSALISLTVPRNFYAVANGNLREKTDLRDEAKVRYDWFVSYPINNYNVSLNVGRYVHFSDVYHAADGEELALDYYVLDYNEARAKKHFKQVHGVLQAYEHYFGKYPFWEDGYALIETPYLGMEHQSGIAYGNRYMRGYLGGMVPHGMNWDYIIVHETGHEYFGNSISVADRAEMWIHESFTTYMEALYVEFHYGKQRAVNYLRSQRPYIKNKSPLLGPPGVNYEEMGTSDQYYKGAWMLHTLRTVIDDDPLWFGLLRELYRRFRMRTVSTADIVAFVNDYTQTDHTAFFAQYLEEAALPELLVRKHEGRLEYRWRAGVADFNMPVDVFLAGKRVRIQPTTYDWQRLHDGPLPCEAVVFKTKEILFRVDIECE